MPVHRPAPVNHYENFPVASWLCPPALRPAVAAIYWFARTADDLADEGDARAAQRLDDLAAYRADLLTCFDSRTPSPRWAGVFAPLAVAIQRHDLPRQPLLDLLSAFEQDVRRTELGQGYADRADLLDYCSRSANPIGRLVLHLHGVATPQALAESDAICSALQLINFWQDLSRDVPRGRHYLPTADCQAHGLDATQPATWHGHAARHALLRELCDWTRGLMLSGRDLPLRVPGRAGWELRTVVQGGLRVLDKIESQGSDAFSQRPRLRAWDAPLIAWRCLRWSQARTQEQHTAPIR